MGLYIDNKPMTKKEVLEFLHLPANSIPTIRKKIIEVNSKVVDDKGTRRPTKSIGGKPEYLIFVPHLEREVKVRYATSQRKDKDDNWTYPFPKTLQLRPAEDGTELITDEMQFLFWFLRPMCLHSPFHVKGAAHYYQFQDNDARAIVEMEREEKYINALSILVGPQAWSDVQLKHLAKGMNLVGVDDMTPMVVKQKLKGLAHKDPVNFYNNANSREILFTGKIQEAIDQNILILKSVNGMQRWYLKGEEILPIQYGQDPLNELKSHMAAKWYLYEQSINNELNNVNVKTLLENPINDAAFDNEAKALTRKVRVELTPEQEELMKEIRSKDWLEDKMNKIDSYFVDGKLRPKLMPSQLKSYEDNKHFYEAWKLAQEEETEQVQA